MDYKIDDIVVVEDVSQYLPEYAEVIGRLGDVNYSITRLMPESHLDEIPYLVRRK